MIGRAPVYKTVLIGEGGVGKTSIAVRYTEDRFDEHMKMTIGVNFASKKIDVDGAQVTLMLWDLGGQPRFQDVVVDYFKGSRIAFAVYDATRIFTLDRLESWIEKLKVAVPDCEIYLMANKIDERELGSEIDADIIEEAKQKYNAIHFEVSAKSGEGVSEVFEFAAKYLVDKFHKHRD